MESACAKGEESDCQTVKAMTAMSFDSATGVSTQHIRWGASWHERRITDAIMPQRATERPVMGRERELE